MITDQIRYSLHSLRGRKLRSWLTAFSILIGVTAIFALVSFGLGISGYINRIAEEAGSDKLFLQAKGIGAPGTDENFFLVEEDLDFVSKIKGVDEISGIYSKAGDIGFKGELKTNFVIGFDATKLKFIEEVHQFKIVKGRGLKKSDVDKAVIGYNYQFDDKIFSRALELGDKIGINGHLAEVVGFYDEVGNPADDANVYLSYKGMEEFFKVDGNFGYAMIKISKGEDPEEVADKIQEKLRKFKGQEEGREDFFVHTFSDVLETFSSIIVIINGVLLLIALISIVVASVNIMNTMYTAVLERTKEIGIMKAIGARNGDIMFIFIFEAGFLGAAGGIAGVFMGYLAAKIGENIAGSSGFALLQPLFPPGLIIGCILFAFAVGAAAGYLPARQASRLEPVEALRYE